MSLSMTRLFAARILHPERGRARSNTSASCWPSRLCSSPSPRRSTTRSEGRSPRRSSTSCRRPSPRSAPPSTRVAQFTPGCARGVRAPRRRRATRRRARTPAARRSALGAAARAARQRQAQRERGAAAGALADHDRAAHRLRELGGDRQAEADAVAHVARHERAQDRGPLRLGDARAGVADDDLARSHPRADVDRDLAVRRRRMQRVRDEVGDDLQDAVAVAEHDRASPSALTCSSTWRPRASSRCAPTALLADRRARSTSSTLSENRRVSSRARSSRSPIRRCRRPASASTISSDACCSSSPSITPSAIACTWPWIAVSGVRSSCEMRIRKLRSCSLASLSWRAICSKRSASWPSSSGPFDVRCTS